MLWVFFQFSLSPGFKTLRLNEWRRQELLPLVRCYLLGWFADNVSPEVKSKLQELYPGTVTLILSLMMWPLSLRYVKPTAARSNVSATVNSTEVNEIDETRWQSLAYCCLTSLTRLIQKNRLSPFRNWPSLGRGIIASPHSTSFISLWKNADLWHWENHQKTSVSLNRGIN